MIRCFHRPANAGNLTWGGHCGCKSGIKSSRRAQLQNFNRNERRFENRASLPRSRWPTHERVAIPKGVFAFLDITLQDGGTLWLQKVVSVVVTGHLQTQSKRAAAREPSLPRRHWPTRACSDPKRCFGDYSRPSAKWTLVLVSIPLTFKLV